MIAYHAHKADSDKYLEVQVKAQNKNRHPTYKSETQYQIPTIDQQGNYYIRNP